MLPSATIHVEDGLPTTQQQDGTSENVPSPGSNKLGGDVEMPVVETKNDDSSTMDKKQVLRTFYRYALSLFTGALFGVAIERARISTPYTIIAQMGFTNFVMMRMFLGASVTSAVLVTLLHIAGVKERVPKDSTRIGVCTQNRFGGNILGGFLLGTGMRMSGACPGTVWPQLACDPGLRTGLIIAGGVTAVIMFGYMHKSLSVAYDGFLAKIPDYNRGNHKVLNILSICAITAIVVAIILFNHFLPWEGQMEQIVDQNISATGFLGAADPEAGVWDPLYAGILVGSLQLISLHGNGCCLGMSTGWLVPAYCIASIFDRNIEQNAPYLQKYSTWQAFSAIGAILGALLSSTLLETSPLTAKAIAAEEEVGVKTFIGGFLLLLGARIGSGCTSGHGLSGVALMSLSSMITVAFMFVGGLVASGLEWVY